MKSLKCVYGSNKGFSMLELITVLMLAATIAAVAIPSFVTWRQSVAFRTTAREISNILRDARSRTIVNNLQHRVEFQLIPIGRYRMTAGDRAANSDTWNIPGSATLATATNPAWTPIPSSAKLVLTDNNISFNPNGTANLAAASSSIFILESAGTATRFTVRVDNTGRISIQ